MTTGQPHIVTRVQHRHVPSPGAAEVGDWHWHVSCHITGCEWKPEGSIGECPSGGPKFTEEVAAEVVAEHMAETQEADRLAELARARGQADQ